MRHGFTTGSCAAAAAGAACYMLLSGKEMRRITVQTPGGLPFYAKLEQIERLPGRVRCCVVKDGGDDPDITTGAHITAEVSLPESKASLWQPDPDAGADPEKRYDKSQSSRIVIKGGAGVGKVTAPGLDQPVGEAAINHVPREMICRQVLEACEECEYNGPVQVIISVPEGETLAAKTFNPRLGIKGGISILGTSGIVEPMSSQALLDTIRTELNQKKAFDWRIAAVSPGNYGLDFMKSAYDFDLDRSVKCSNFIGDTIDMAAQIGFDGLLLTGHIGKLVKVAGGIMNTHSKEGDCRMELLGAAAVRTGCDLETVRQILASVSTEEGVRILKERGALERTMEDIMARIMFFLRKRADERLKIECMVYSSEFGLLGKSEGALEMLETIRQQAMEESRRRES